MSLTSIVALLQTALMLLATVQSTPNLPASVVDNATQTAQNAIHQATLSLQQTSHTNTTNTTTAIPAYSAVSCPFVSHTCPTGQYDQVDTQCNHSCVSYSNTSTGCASGMIGTTGSDGKTVCVAGTNDTSPGVTNGATGTGDTSMGCVAPAFQGQQHSCSNGGSYSFVPTGNGTNGICSGYWTCAIGM